MRLNDSTTLVYCKALGNGPPCGVGKAEGLGFHPGSGAQRPVLEDCVSEGNNQGIFFCWGVTDGRVRRCVCSGNRDFGITVRPRRGTARAELGLSTANLLSRTQWVFYGCGAQLRSPF